jgi:transcriptional regulator with XRE-family HTH domain
MTPHSNQRISTPVDAYVGRRLKQRRDEIGMTQETLAGHLNISFQQVQKYERGHNRVSASRLFQLCGLLRVEPGFFFDGLTPPEACGVGGQADLPDPASTAALLAAPGALELLAEYARIIHPGQRMKVIELVRLLAPKPADVLPPA